MNLITEGLTLHASRLQEAGGEVVTFRRGSSSVKLTAVVGSSDSEEQNAEGETTAQLRLVDFIFKASELILGGKQIEPVRGDQIIRANGDVFDVYPTNDAAPSVFNDGREVLHRVHTVRRVTSK
jgi:hypothetical protein